MTLRTSAGATQAAQPSARSLTNRALRLLARREHSAAELRRKLSQQGAADADIDSVIAELTRRGWFSQQRFVEQLARSRAAKFGTLRIADEFRRHDIDRQLAEQYLAPLRADEAQRAQALWQRRFGVAPAAPAERAKQHRFLAQRGFSAEAIAAVLRRAGSSARQCNADDAALTEAE